MPSKTAPLPPTESSVTASELTFHKKKTFETKTDVEKVKAEDSAACNMLRMCCCSMTSCSAFFLLVLITVVALFVWACIFTAGYISTDDAIQSLRHEIRRNAIQDLNDNLKQPMRILLDQGAALEEQGVDFQNQNQIYSIARTMMKTMTFYNSITFSLFLQWTNGNHVHAKYADANETEFQLEIGNATMGVAWHFNFYVNRTDGNYTSLETLPFEDNISDTDWFQRAIFQDKPTVTPFPIELHEPTNQGGLLGFTYTSPVYAKDGSLTFIAGADVGLNNLGDVLSNISIGKTGSSMLLQRTGVLIGTSGDNTLADGSGEQTHAIDSKLKIHSKIAKKIEDSATIDRVPDGYSLSLDGYVADVVVIDPTLYDGTKLLTRDWIYITALPVFRDYTQIMLWSNLVAVFLMSILVIGISVISIIMYVIIFVRPLLNLIKDMEAVQSMQLDKIKVRRLEQIFETRELQKRFYKSLHFLKLWRQFISPQLLNAQLKSYNGEDADEQQTDNDDDWSSMSASMHSSSKKTGVSGKSSKNSSGARKRMRERAALSTFEVGVREMKLAVVAVRLIGSTFVTEMDADSFCRQHSSMLSAFESVVKIQKGIVDRFSDKYFIASFYSARQAAAASVEISRKLKIVEKKLNTEERNSIGFCLGLSFDVTCLGVLGTDSMRNNRVFGNGVDQATTLACIGEEWPAKILIDRTIMKSIDKKAYVIRPVCHRAQPAKSTLQVYEILSTTKIDASEWLYESRDKEKIEVVECYRQAYRHIQNQEWKTARDLLQKYLQTNSDDDVARKHLKEVEENIVS